MSAEIAKSRVNFYHLNINYGPRTFVRVQMNKKTMLMNPVRNEWFGYKLGDSAKWDDTKCTKWWLKSAEHRVWPFFFLSVQCIFTSLSPCIHVKAM